MNLFRMSFVCAEHSDLRYSEGGQTHLVNPHVIARLVSQKRYPVPYVILQFARLLLDNPQLPRDSLIS